MLRRRSYALTDVGRKRPHNEDAFVADDTLGLYVVADGVGGHAKGEVASAESVEQVRNYVIGAERLLDELARESDEPPPPETPRPGAPAASVDLDVNDLSGEAPATSLRGRRLAARRLLESAVQSACYHVYAMAEQDPTGHGMSTTVSALLVAGAVAIVAQVGDSRVYRLRGGRARQVTHDHTLANHQLQQGLVTPEQAATMRGRNVITRAVGHRDYVEVDTFALDLAPGDRFLVCSDGLHGYLRDGEVELLLAEPRLELSARRFIDLALDRGGKDNITAVVLAIA